MPEPVRVAYTLEQCWHTVPGGTATSALELAWALLARDDVELVGVAGRHRRPAAADVAPPMPVRSLPLARPWLYECWNRWGWPAVERATGDVDACHSTLAIPAPTSAASIVTIHDVAFVHAPEHFTSHGARVMRAGLERCRQADLIVCPSRATGDDLAELGFDADRIRVIPWGVRGRPVDATELARVRAAYALPSEFVLFVGTVEPRKNLPRLAEAVAALGVPLVVAGAAGWGDGAPPAASARFLGYVPAADLPALYSTASVFAYPSLHEGFGMPIAEAMAQGTPVVTGHTAATAEVAGGAAVLADPLDVASITDALQTALADPGAWRARGLRRAAELSWDAAAAATVAAYREAIERRPC